MQLEFAVSISYQLGHQRGHIDGRPVIERARQLDDDNGTFIVDGYGKSHIPLPGLAVLAVEIAASATGTLGQSELGRSPSAHNRVSHGSVLLIS